MIRGSAINSILIAALCGRSAIHGVAAAKPSILIAFGDDMGYRCSACDGGGAAIGASLPNLDRLARDRPKLTCCDSQQTRSPISSRILTGRLPVGSCPIRPQPETIESTT